MPKLDANWRTILVKAWSMRLLLFWSALCGLYYVLPAFIDVIPARVLALVSMAVSMAIAVARVTHQPGVD